MHVTVAMELETALNHSAQRPRSVVEEPEEGEVNETHEAQRRQNTPHPGTRPSILKELEPQVGDAATSYVAAASRSLMVPRLAADKPIDSFTLNFLFRKCLEAKEEEEEEQKKEKEMVLHNFWNLRDKEVVTVSSGEPELSLKALPATLLLSAAWIREKARVEGALADTKLLKPKHPRRSTSSFMRRSPTSPGRSVSAVRRRL